MQGINMVHSNHPAFFNEHEVYWLNSSLAPPIQESASATSQPAVQHGTSLPGISLNQLLQIYLQQQQQAYKAALADWIMSVELPASMPAHQPWQPRWQLQLQPPGLCGNTAAEATWQYQTASQAPSLCSSQVQLAGQSATPCAAACPHLTNTWAVQHTLGNCNHSSTSTSMDWSATEAQLQRLLSGCQIPFGSLDNTYKPPIVVDHSCTANAFGSAATAAAFLQLSLNQLELQENNSSRSSSYNNLADNISSSSSSSIGSPSRTSSLHNSISLNSSASWGSAAFSNAVAAAASPVSSDSLDEDDLPLVHTHFCRQEISLALNTAVTVLLTTLRSMQYTGENPYPKMHRLYVCGLRESCKAVKSGKAKAVLLAPDIQVNKFGKTDRMLDGRMNDIIVNSQLQRPGCPAVPVVFALSRKKIGQVFGGKKRMSAIAVLDANGIEDLLAMVVQLAEEGKQQWAEMNGWSVASGMPC